MKTFNVYSVSILCLNDSLKRVDDYRFFSSKLKAINTYLDKGYSVCDVDDVDKLLTRVRMFNDETQTYIYIRECEVE